ncbi:MAG TPA: serine/threonine-protein kinase [Labilithrix sp.]|nr:serine/threonine-protein kinase [Labilithrix sp.]
MEPDRSTPQRSPLAANVTPGDVLAGKFRAERIVGRGGMGVVIEATNLQLGQKVALKVLAKGADDAAVVDRFMREARAAAGLRSEHVARVYDVGKDPSHGPFIVMELLDGRPLTEVMASVGRVPIHRAVEYVIDACEGLGEAHARGIVHQDVKPANLFLATGSDGRPTIKVLDFGIATVRSKGREVDAKASHASAGTPAYLSPEQVRTGTPVDHRTDIWSLGCVLYELLANERPFRATRFTELITQILEADPHPFPVDADVPSQVAAVIARCLEKDPTRRWSSTGEMALTLLPFARARAHSAVARAVAHAKAGGLGAHLDMPSSMPPPPVDLGLDFPSSAMLRAPAVPKFSSGPVAAHVPSAAPKAEPRSRRTLAVAGLVALGLATGVGVIVHHSSEEPKATATSATPTTTLTAAETAKASATVTPTFSAPPSPSGSDAAAEPRAKPSEMASTPPKSRAAPPPPASPRGHGATTASPASRASSESEIRHTR